MRHLTRRRSLVTLAGIAAPAIIPYRAIGGTTLPDKPLRILVGSAAGGGAELMARVIVPTLERRTGRRVSIENKPSGADAAPGEYFVKDLVDGTAVAFLPSTTLAPNLAGMAFPFDVRSRLVPLTMAGAFQVAIAVSPKIGVSTFAEYVAWLRVDPPKRARLGTTAVDLYQKIYSMMIGREIGVRLLDIPHGKASRLIAALRADEIPLGLGSVVTLLQHDFDRRVSFLMTSGEKRVSVLPNVPTASDLGYPNLELKEWYGFFASSDTASPIVAEWSRQLRAVLTESEVVAALAQFGLDVETSTPGESTARLAFHEQAWKARMEALGLQSGD